jgi:uncharacterized protein
MEGTAQSPCIRNCCLDDDDICLGCYRSIAEIIQWGPANNPERIIILQNVQKRRDTATKGCSTENPGKQ